MSAALLYPSFGLNSTLTLYTLPHYVWALLGSHVIIFPEALLGISNIQVPYVLIDSSHVVHEEITGAILKGEKQEIRDQMYWLHEQPGWFSRATVVILTSSPDLEVFRISWAMKTANVVVVTSSGLYAYNPFFDSIFPVGEHVRKNLTQRWRDMNGHKISVTMYEHQLGFRKELGITLASGVDGAALYELSKYWNMNVNLIMTKYTEVTQNPAVFNLLQGKADIALNAHSIFPGTSRLEYSPVVLGDTICLVFKTPSRLRGWDVLLRIYNWKVYIALLAVAVLANKAMHVAVKNRSWKGSFVMILKAILNIPIPCPPKAVRDRFILGSTMIFGFIIVTTFQALLFHFISSNVHYRKMDTLADVWLNNITLRTNYSFVKDLFVTWELTEVQKLSGNLKVGNAHDGMLDYAGLVIPEQEFGILLGTNLIRKDVYVLPERLGSYTMAYTVKKGSPFLPPLTDFTLRAFECDLYRRWYHLTGKRFHLFSAEVEHEHFRALKRSDTEAAFFALSVGHILAFIVFLLELLINKLTMERLLRIWDFLGKLLNRVCC